MCRHLSVFVHRRDAAVRPSSHGCEECLERGDSWVHLRLFRSQHVNQSWFAALTAILDTCALIRSTMEDGSWRTARLTFAMARHAAVDPTGAAEAFGDLPGGESSVWLLEQHREGLRGAQARAGPAPPRASLAPAGWPGHARVGTAAFDEGVGKTPWF